MPYSHPDDQVFPSRYPNQKPLEIPGVPDWVAGVTISPHTIDIFSRRSQRRGEGASAAGAALDREFGSTAAEVAKYRELETRLADARARLEKSEAEYNAAHKRLAVAAISTGDQRVILSSQRAQNKAAEEMAAAEAEISALADVMPGEWDKVCRAHRMFHSQRVAALTERALVARDEAVKAVLAALAPHIDNLVLASTHLQQAPIGNLESLIGPRPAGPATNDQDEHTPVVDDLRLSPFQPVTDAAPPLGETVIHAAAPGRVASNGVAWHQRLR